MTLVARIPAIAAVRVVRTFRGRITRRGAGTALAAVLLTATAPGWADAHESAAAAVAAARGDCAPARPAPPTAGVQVIRHAGVDRSYLLATPNGYDGTTARPLLFDFHGFGGSMRDQETNTQL